MSDWDFDNVNPGAAAFVDQVQFNSHEGVNTPILTVVWSAAAAPTYKMAPVIIETGD